MSLQIALASALCLSAHLAGIADPVRDITDYAESLSSKQNPTLAVRQLGADDAKVRRAAKKTLVGMGAKAIPALKDGLKADDPEVRLTCRDILAKVSKTDSDSEWFKRRIKANAALRQLAEKPEPEAWDPLLKVLMNADEPQRLLAASAIAKLGPDRYKDLSKALETKSLTEDRVLLVVQDLLDTKQDEAAIAAHAKLKALLPRAKKALAAQANWKPSWTTGKIDKHIYGLHKHTYESAPIAPMNKPVLGVAYGHWGGKGKGDRSGKMEFTVSANGVKLGTIPTDYSGYISPGPSGKLFDLSAVATKGVFEITILAGSGGDSVIGEVKIFDMLKKDPGVVKIKDKFYGVGKDTPIEIKKK